MRVSREKAAQNRDAVIETASRLFRQRGFDGIGLKDLMEAAGLTQGAFYKQFKSKEDLIVQSSERAFESAGRRWAKAAEASPTDPLSGVVSFYLSMQHRDEQMDSCPAATLGADSARQSVKVKASFEAGLRAYLEMLDGWSSEAGGPPSDRAMTNLSTMVGAILLARAVNDAELAKNLLGAAAKSVRGSVQR